MKFIMEGRWLVVRAPTAAKQLAQARTTMQHILLVNINIIVTQAIARQFMFFPKARMFTL